MFTNSLYRWSLALALSGALLASPAAAQGKGKQKEKGKERARPELVRRAEARPASSRLREELREREDDRRDDARRDDDRRDDAWWDDVLGGDRDEGRRSDVPRGWCQGRGNPHNTPENCGYGASRSDRAWYDGSGRDYATYEQAHEDFHRRHDAECRIRAAERPLDLQYQLRVRQQCRESHDAWHARAGRRHG